VLQPLARLALCRVLVSHRTSVVSTSVTMASNWSQAYLFCVGFSQHPRHPPGPTPSPPPRGPPTPPSSSSRAPTRSPRQAPPCCTTLSRNMH
ncbi:hypothetical protein JB92DRAFT_3076823, partial [Gautieria morchelliformis]